MPISQLKGQVAWKVSGQCPLPPVLHWAGGRASLALFPLETDLKTPLNEGPLRVAPCP